MRAFPHMIAAGVLALGLGAAASPALAQEAAEQQAEEDFPTELEVAGVSVAAQLPCDEPRSPPNGIEGREVFICMIEDTYFVFGKAEGEALVSARPFVSDFDKLRADIADSKSTVMLEDEMLAGRRHIRATQGPLPKFGMVHAIEVEKLAVVYVAVISNGTSVSDNVQAVARSFIETLEVLD